MASIEEIAATLRSVAAAGMKPKELLAAVRERHPEASKKEVVRAAFYALIESHGTGPEHADSLHGFAIGARNADEDAPAPKLRRKRRSRRDAPAEQPTA